jgi:hypothetical protein
MSDRVITDIKGIGPKTEQKLRKRLRKNRPTSRAGEKVSVRDVERNQEVARFVLAADQQRALRDAGSRLSLDRNAKRKEAAASREERRQQRQESDTIRRGDFRVSKEGIREAQDRFEDLPSEERSDDKSSREPVTTDRDLWSENIDTFDYPGVDTPSSRRVRAEPSDSVLNSPTSQQRPRENWRDSQPERTATQERLGEQPDKADAERTGIYRAGDGEFVQRPLRPAGDGQFVSQNGQVVTSLQDPTIGRDPDDGEFEDMPLGREPGVPLPQTGSVNNQSDILGEFVKGEDPFDMSTGGGALDGGTRRESDAEPGRLVEYGGEQVDLTEKSTDDLEQINSFLSRNIDAEVEAQRAKGGMGTSDFAQELAQRQGKVSAELNRRRS